MAFCTLKELRGLAQLSVEGRIDGMSSPEVQQHLEQMIRDGKRYLLVDLASTTFLSSLGLRLFFAVQKELKKVGGELILFQVPEKLKSVFTVGGFDRFFRFVDTEQGLLDGEFLPLPAGPEEQIRPDGTVFRLREYDAVPETLALIGSSEKLSRADYQPEDVVPVPQGSYRYGTGLAASGEGYEEFKSLFGEALLLNHHFFYYPAVSRPAVDFMIYSGPGSNEEFRFLHGFGFGGSCRYVASFEAGRAYVTLDEIADWVLALPSGWPMAGMVLLAESKGIFGMNLKKSPIRENRPATGEEIFDGSQFPAWVNFPLEPADENHIVAAVGIACRDLSLCRPEVRKLFSRDTRSHLHGCVFQKGPIHKNPDAFEGELSRVLTELNPVRVQHLLGRSRFSSGVIGMIELKG